MNKKSNVIVGAAAVGIIGIIFMGISLFGPGKGGESGKQAALVESKAIARVAEVPEVRSGTSSASLGGEFVASKQGKKYFPADCGTAKSIKEENKVFFGSEAEAVQAGYERSLTCK